MRRLMPLLLVLTLTGCASGNAFLVSGATVEVLGTSFVATAKTYNTLLDQKAITAEQYKSWATFATKFKQTYPLVVASWKKAVVIGDDKAQQTLTAIVTTLVGELGQYAQLVASK